ncbi:UDP-N-acetylmuramate--L-alanine ligase [Alkalitalea saponilacus]|uniref:UDP-N-acetylmuramate: L-alanyl-gamma-D-glutamyl-meso-diaminopimelate ligase n=1 Tax=Alkalitalea saponilacus TaxID=889453 RepID=A0A1T5A0Z4_9BACT|nr:Mur ligase family protein [Alkalitalea saponilacus]ASB48915.1 peptidoglycan synthetase [Alkalitalea saponilacus]SKB28701.1 UDP-N-acetylmuramate: L-alanyl-gamma-D-glutamyl-meso-diaminopimelate ligase [Alkalitalea saponilacus]
MKIHFIAIGGSAMHNLAIALKENGAEVSGSDDEIFEPSKTRLKKHGLLPETEGWHPEKITKNLNAIILGMHARKDNPELQAAVEQGIKVYSYPEFLYEQSKNKTRVVIAGSHGKTTVTSMVMHALKVNNVDFDYMVGAQLEGFDTMVKISKTAKIAIFEGDEYLSSPIDLRPKFLWYKPDIALITGVAWDHINVFPTIEEYNKQFELFIDSVRNEGYLTWFENDPVLANLIKNKDRNISIEPYQSLESIAKNRSTIIRYNNKDYPVPVFGKHNMENMAGALNICLQLGLTADDFLTAMRSFKGAARRLQQLAETSSGVVFYDFAHAPSKVKATVEAVKERFPERNLVTILELHTFSSLNKEFLPQYKDTLQLADEPIVFYNPDVLSHKKLATITPKEVANAFGIDEKNIITTADQLETYISKTSLNNSNLLIMTSGNLGGIDLKNMVDKLVMNH